VRLAPHIPRFQEARDPELVLWLVGTHHGYGRPFFPHSDVEDAKVRTNLPDVLGIPHNTIEAGASPQSLAFDWKGLDWPGLYECLKARYGVWELARMEAILRLADHRASEPIRVKGTADAKKGAA
jgi:CRISPR-associated endonuclease/helicase Cas3